MKNADYYINGVGVISPQNTFNNAVFLPEIITHETSILSCLLPDFKAYINPIQLRRLSRMLRMGLSSAIICLRNSTDAAPHGIITATGYGFLTETARFLTEIYDYGEKQLTPTYFMQSTYNALSGLVALTLKCKGYNNTHVNRGFAFETALHDAMMQLSNNREQTFLVGAFDEMDPAQHKINSRAGHYRAEVIRNTNLFDDANATGSIQGEGASFFSLSGIRTPQTWCRLKDVKMIFCPDSTDTLRTQLMEFLSYNKISVTDIDVLISGVSGDRHHDTMINELAQTDFSQIPELRFKHLCGEYATASSFGVWMGAAVLKWQQIPNGIQFNKIEMKPAVKTVLLINQYMGRNYCFIVLQLG